jgi:hypothetical protein
MGVYRVIFCQFRIISVIKGFGVPRKHLALDCLFDFVCPIDLRPIQHTLTRVRQHPVGTLRGGVAWGREIEEVLITICWKIVLILIAGRISAYVFTVIWRIVSLKLNQLLQYDIIKFPLTLNRKLHDVSNTRNHLIFQFTHPRLYVFVLGCAFRFQRNFLSLAGKHLRDHHRWAEADLGRGNGGDMLFF